MPSNFHRRLTDFINAVIWMAPTSDFQFLHSFPGLIVSIPKFSDNDWHDCQIYVPEYPLVYIFNSFQLYYVICRKNPFFFILTITFGLLAWSRLSVSTKTFQRILCPILFDKLICYVKMHS